MKTERIMAALRKHFAGDHWIYLEELRAGAGFGIDSQRRFDAWAMATAPSKGNERLAFEVKVSRSDFKRDLAKPLKQRPARLSANRFYYVAPLGLIKPEELPVWAGLWELDHVPAHDPWKAHDYFQTAVPAPFFETEPPTWRFVVSLLRHAARHASTDRYSGEGNAA